MLVCYTLDKLFLLGYIHYMEYTIKLTDECQEWILGLSNSEQVDVLASINLLEAVGPNLDYPHSSKINGSKHSHMRELRTQHRGKPYRLLYAFDPTRSAILLIGGNKAGDKRWYKKFIAVADKLYSEHIKKLKR